MLLRSTLEADAKDERELRTWLINEIGEADQLTLVDWVWENHRGNNDGITFVDALAAIVRQTGTHGRGFLNNLLDFAKKPKEIREAEQAILGWIKPRIEKAASVVLGHRGDAQVKREQFHELCSDLEAFIHRAYPLVHRATVKGAIVSAMSNTGTAFSLNVARLVKALTITDPLAATAPVSWA